jgi:hypothetical protein
MTAANAPRRTTRLLGLVGACALAVAALSGCLKLDADLTINADATASGTLDIEFQKEAAGFLGISDLASFEENFTGEELGADLGQFSDCTTSESDTAYVYSCTFEDEAFDSPDNPWTITKEGDLITLSVVNEGQSSEDDALLGDASLGSISVSATFPGPITAVSGDAAEKTSDTTATISGSLTDAIDASVTSEASSQAFSLSALLVVLLTLAVIALIVIVVVVMIMRRRRAREEVDSPIAQDAGASTAVMETVSTDAASTDVAEAVVDTEAAPDTTVTETLAVGETVAEPVTEAVPEPVTEALPEAVTEPVAETVAEPVTEPVAETVAEPVTEPVAETVVPETVVDAAPDVAPEVATEGAADAAAETTPDPDGPRA